MNRLAPRQHRDPADNRNDLADTPTAAVTLQFNGATYKAHLTGAEWRYLLTELAPFIEHATRICAITGHAPRSPSTAVHHLHTPTTTPVRTRTPRH